MKGLFCILCHVYFGKRYFTLQHGDVLLPFVCFDRDRMAQSV